jgi:hypothetical protein
MALDADGRREEAVDSFRLGLIGERLTDTPCEGLIEGGCDAACCWEAGRRAVALMCVTPPCSIGPVGCLEVSAMQVSPDAPHVLG